MAELKIPIIVDIEEIKEYLSSNDVVEIVRCKDCKYYDSKSMSGLQRYGLCEKYVEYKNPNGFCDIGERRESE